MIQQALMTPYGLSNRLWLASSGRSSTIHQMKSLSRPWKLLQIVAVTVMLSTLGLLPAALIYGADPNLPPSSAALRTGEVGVSVWPDDSVSLAIPILNPTVTPAADVQVTSIALGRGTRVDGATLPIALGEIVGGARQVVDTRFASLAVPGQYVLTVTGTFRVAARLFQFTSDTDITVARAIGTSVEPDTTFVPKQDTSGAPLPPSPIPVFNPRANPPGPPIPIGPTLEPHTVPPNNTSTESQASATNVTFFRDTRTGQAGNFPPDPTAAAANGVVFASGNTYVLFSIDNGTIFTRIDPTTPTTIFPQSDGGLCCDQVITYVPSVNLFFWLLQYRSGAIVPAVPPATMPAPGPGPNRLRIAFASPESMISNFNSAWTYVDLQSSTFRLGNMALDYPDLAFTDTYLYVSVDRQVSSTSVDGLIVARMSLSELADPAVTTVGIEYYEPPLPDVAAGPGILPELIKATASRLTQSSSDAMYWAGHYDTNRMVVFAWPDNSDRVNPPHLTSENTWCKTDYASEAPDRQQWIPPDPPGRGAVIGAARKEGEVWFAWNAGRDSGQGTRQACIQGRPQPFVKIVRVNDRTLDSVGEYHIWNPDYAFAYPALAVQPFTDEIGVSVAFGGPNHFPSTTVGFLGDFVVYFNELSDVTLTFIDRSIDAAGNVVIVTDSAGNPVIKTRYGDYFVVRNSGPLNQRFSSLGYAVRLVNPMLSNSCVLSPMDLTSGGCMFFPHYVQWGRSSELIP